MLVYIKKRRVKLDRKTYSNCESVKRQVRHWKRHQEIDDALSEFSFQEQKKNDRQTDLRRF